MDHHIHPHSHFRSALSTPTHPTQSALTPPNPDNRHNFHPTLSQSNQRPSPGNNNSNCATISPQTSPYPTLGHQIIQSETVGQQQPISMASIPNSNQNHSPAYEWMVRNLHEITHRYRYLEALLQSKDAELNRHQGNEAYFRQQLGFSHQKYKIQEQNNEKLRGEVQSLKQVTQTHSQSVPKSQYDEVLLQNKKIAENNVKLNQQNEDLLNNVEQQKHRASELGSQNGKLFMESLVLEQEIIDLREQLRQQRQMQQQYGPDEHIERVKKLEANIVEEQEKVKCLEEKLSSAESRNNTQVKEVQDKLNKADAQILLLNNKLKDSSANIETFLAENQNLLQKMGSFECERKQQALEKEELKAKNEDVISTLQEKLGQNRVELQKKDEGFRKLLTKFEELKQKSESECNPIQHRLESESERQAKIITLELNNKIEVLNKNLDEQKAKSARKSKFIAALKNLIGQNEKNLKEASNSAKELKMQVDSLKLDKDYLNGQLSARIEEIKRLKLEFQSAMNQHEYDEEKLHKCIENLNNLNQQFEKELGEKSQKTEGLEEYVKELETSKDEHAKFISIKVKTEKSLVKLNKRREKELENLKVQEQSDKILISNLNETLLEKENEIKRLQERISEVDESLEKYKTESIENRRFSENILSGKTERSVVSYKESIKWLRRKLEGNRVGQIDRCEELERIGTQTRRPAETFGENFRVEDEVTCLSDEEQKSYESPAKKARRSGSVNE
ncbi:unnamed protein product [Orchesella dallaii]|uniref:Uncharacterized protein n=1 Tax=Orchesella dallaii TaxID=48710 RepID=A0ABP1RI09_9HEXA